MSIVCDEGTSRLLELPPAALLGVDDTGRITLCAYTEPVLGYRDDELIGRPVTVLGIAADLLSRAVPPPGASAAVPVAGITCRRRDGSALAAEVEVSRVRAESGDQTWIAIREAPAWHRAVLNRRLLGFIAESSSDAIISTDVDGIITFWNPAAERLYGYRPAEVLGRPIELLYDEAGLAQWGWVRERLGHGYTVNLSDVIRIRKDGVRLRISVAVSPIQDDEGSVIGAASVARRSETGGSDEADLRFAMLMDAVTLPVVGVTGDGRIGLLNAEAERAFGYRRDELLGHLVETLIPEASRDLHAALRAGYMREPRTRRMGEGRPLEARRRDGTRFPIEVSLAVLSFAEGPRIVAVVRDLTHDLDRERLEQQLEQVHRLDSLGQLAGGIAHDFNNLMGIIGGYAGLVIDDLEAMTPGGLDAAREALLGDVRHIRAAADRAAHLTRQLLAFGRRDISRPTTVDLAALVRESTQLLERTLGAGVAIQVELTDEPLLIRADPGQIERVIINVAINGRDAMPDGGRLTIRCAAATLDEAGAARHGLPAGRYARLSIADTGTGMSAEVARHALDPFFTTKPAGEGTGLGLSIAYGIVASHSGTLDIESEPGRGTALTILFPVLPGEPVPPQPAGPAAEERPAPTRYTVLVVDDEDGMREVARRILQRHGHTALVAADGPEALTLVENHGHLDLLLTDVMMPEMLGIDLAVRVRTLRPDLPVIYMSGYAQPVLAVEGRLEPGTTLLEKPFTESQLIAAITAAVGTGRRAPERGRLVT